MKRYIRSSIQWSDLSESEQMAVEYAKDMIQFDGMDPLDAAGYACNQVGEANSFDEYSGESFYMTEPDRNKVTEYLLQGDSKVFGASFESGKRTLTYKDLWQLVGSRPDKFPTPRAMVKELAQFIYSYGYKQDKFLSKRDSIFIALELYEQMTGRFWDPTQDEFDDIEGGIMG